MHLEVLLVSAVSTLLSLVPLVATSFLPQTARSLDIRNHAVYARSPYAKQFVDGPISNEPFTRPGTPFYPPAARGSTTGASSGSPIPTGTRTGTGPIHRLYCEHNAGAWDPVNDPVHGWVCEDFVKCEGTRIIQYRRTHDEGMIRMCRQRCTCRFVDDHVNEMEQMERGMAGMRVPGGSRPQVSIMI